MFQSLLLITLGQQAAVPFVLSENRKVCDDVASWGRRCAAHLHVVLITVSLHFDITNRPAALTLLCAKHFIQTTKGNAFMYATGKGATTAL